MNISNAKVGTEITYSGFAGTIIEVCTGVLAGMVVVRLRAGTACVSAEEVIEAK